MNAVIKENQLAALTEYDFIVAVDASGSMGTEDMKGGRSRWAAMQETVEQFAREVSKIDSDGLGLVIFGGTNVTAHDGVDAAKVAEIFSDRRPSGSTPLAEALQTALRLAGKSAKKDFIVVFTDGVPDDKAAAEQVIRAQANKQQTDDELTMIMSEPDRLRVEGYLAFAAAQVAASMVDA